MNSTPPADWQPVATADILCLRAELLARTRAFFAARDVLEVDTPALSAAAATDAALHSFVTRYRTPGAANGTPYYLHTSPEFPMKRLLAAGSGSIYQLCKVFRDGEAGRLHNPEFTLLEWYRVGWNHLQLMDEVAALVQTLIPARIPATGIARLTYQELFQRYAGIDGLLAEAPELQACAVRHGVNAPELNANEPAPWRDLLLTHVIEPQLREVALLVHDFPADQAALARVRADEPPVAERFELYIGGVELANGFHELADPAEQAQRFDRDRRLRARRGLADVPADARLLAALHAGLPDCAGVALGFDRLVMLAAAADTLQAVLAFPFARA